MLPLFLACGAVLVFHAFLIFRVLFSLGCASSLRSLLSTIRAPLCSFRNRTEGSADFAAAVASQLSLMRLEFACCYAGCAQAILPLLVGILFYQDAKSMLEGGAADRVLVPPFSRAQVVLLLVSYVLVLLFYFGPRRIQCSMLDIWYLVAMALLITMIAPTVAPTAMFLLQHGGGASIRICVGMIASNGMLSSFLNTLYTLVRCSSVLLDSSESLVGSAGSRAAFLHGELVALLITTLALRLFQQCMVARCTLEIESKLARSQGIAVRSLLNLMCDAVVELDSDLIITEDVPKLSGLLMDMSRRNLKGLTLKQWMPPEDQDVFDLHLRGGCVSEMAAHTEDAKDTDVSADVDGAEAPGSKAPGRDQPRAGLFHLKMQADGEKKQLDVEIFHVCFNFLDKPRHFIGIREDACVPPEGRLGPPSIVDSQSETQARAAGHLFGSCDQGGSVESSEAGRSFGSSFTAGECVFATFDILSPRLEILEMSSRWIEVCGWPEGCEQVGVNDYLDDRILPEFRVFLSDCLNRTSVQGWDPANATVPFRSLRSVMPDGVVSTTRIAVTFLDPIDASDVETGRYKAKLSVTYCPKGSRIEFRGGSDLHALPEGAELDSRGTAPVTGVRSRSRNSRSNRSQSNRSGSEASFSTSSTGSLLRVGSAVGSNANSTSNVKPKGTGTGSPMSALIRTALVDAAKGSRNGSSKNNSPMEGNAKRSKSLSPSEPPAFVKLLSL